MKEIAAAALGAAVLLAGCQRKQEAAGSARKAAPKIAKGEVFQAEGTDPKAMLSALLKPMGGIEAFVKKGSKVVIKPNCGWSRTPLQAANTNPQVVAAMIEICRTAGAAEVLVIEHTCDTPSQLVFAVSGMKAAVDAAGGKLVSAHQRNLYQPITIPNAVKMPEAEVLTAITQADCFINMPVAKHHGATKLSLGLKNLMGAVWDRQWWHVKGLSECIADFASVVIPDLTIIDATRILLDNGPKGPGTTRQENKILASTDPVAVDAVAAGLFGLKPSDLEFLKMASSKGLGEMDLKAIKLTRV